MKRCLLPALLALAGFPIHPLHAALVDTFPMIVRADSVATITLVFTNNPAIAITNDIRVHYICADGIPANSEILPCKIEGNTVTVTTRFHGETEHTLNIIHNKPGGKTPKILETAMLYSLKPDYFALRPYRGEFHLHSRYSDGRKNETPAMMVAACRKLGYDFASVTDHRSYAASLSAIENFAKLPTDMKTFPGEEVHSPGNRVHILSLGASESMTDWFTTKSNEYEKAVAEEESKLPDTLPDTMKPWVAASFVVWDKIRSYGGIAVFCHPYWRQKFKQYIPCTVSDYLLQTGKFDVMEVLNTDSSDLGILHYNELRAQGLKIAGIGVTDAHSIHALGNAYTLILAEALDFPSLAKNIRLRNCAAVNVDPQSKRQTVIGEFRFSRYALFLINHFYPKQNELCKREGEWLLKALAGDAEAVAALKKSQGTTPGLRIKYWQP